MQYRVLAITLKFCVSDTWFGSSKKYHKFSSDLRFQHSQINQESMLC